MIKRVAIISGGIRNHQLSSNSQPSIIMFLQRCDEAHLVLVDSQRLLLFTPTEYRIILLLLTHLGETLPFEEFFPVPFDLERDRALLFKHMTHLREKVAWLGLDIVCCNGYGYTMHPITVAYSQA